MAAQTCHGPGCPSKPVEASSRAQVDMFASLMRANSSQHFRVAAVAVVAAVGAVEVGVGVGIRGEGGGGGGGPGEGSGSSESSSSDRGSRRRCGDSCGKSCGAW